MNSGSVKMINKEQDKKIQEWLLKNRDWIIEEWIKLAKIPSITSEPLPGAPFGKSCKEALEKSCELFRKKGFTADIYSDKYVLAKFGKGERTIGFFSHSDVVPVGDDWIFTEPFEPIIKDNTLIGRGVSDNKSGIMASLCVMMMAKDLGFPIKSTLQTFIGSNEESGMEDIEAFVKEQPMPEISFVPDAEFPCSLGEKGIYHYWAKSDNKFSDIKEISGGEAFNVILDKVTVKISYSEELYKELSEKTKDLKGFNLSCENDMLILLVKGIAKHASMPDGSKNALFMATELLTECKNLAASDKDILNTVKKLTKSGFGEGIELLHEDKYFGRLTMANGIAKTEDGYLKLSFDTRYGLISPEEVEERTKTKLKESGFSVIPVQNMPGFNIPEDGAAPKMFEAIYNEITGKDEKLIYMSGGTYARHLKNAFSIGTEEGRPNGFTMPDGHGGAHQCDEMIDLDGFFKAVQILMHFVLKYEEI